MIVSVMVYVEVDERDGAEAIHEVSGACPVAHIGRWLRSGSADRHFGDVDRTGQHVGGMHLLRSLHRIHVCSHTIARPLRSSVQRRGCFTSIHTYYNSSSLYLFTAERNAERQHALPQNYIV